MPKISIIVPVYKVEEYLLPCVDSILAQSLQDFELILVDDGSPDGCGALCDAYALQDSRIRVIHRENGGLSAARNSGMELAKGDYITFIDSDDLVATGYLEALLWAAETGDAAISVCRYRKFSDNAVPELTESASGIDRRLHSGREAVVALYEGRSEVPVNACAKLFQSALIADLRFPEGRIHEDQAVVPLACYRAERIAEVPAELYFYRDRSNSITTERFTLKRYDDIWAIDRCISFFEAQGEREIVAAARDRRERILASYAIRAKAAGVEIPVEYAVPTGKALRCLRKNCSDDKYTYYLSMIHPKRVLPHAYIQKLKRVLGFEKPADTKKL